MKIIDKKGAKSSSTKSELTVEEIITFSAIAVMVFAFVFFLGTAGHLFYEDYLSNQVQFVPADQVQ